MAEVVYVKLSRASSGINWPPGCPACGVTGRLRSMKAHLVKMKASSNGATVSVGEKTLTVDVPMCAAHASSNEWALTLLEKGVFMTGLRGLSYFSFFMSCFYLYQKLAYHIVLSDIADLLGTGKTGILIFFGFGWLGMLTILWAKSAASVRPIKFDDATKVLLIRFLNKRYAADFKQANPWATQQPESQFKAFFKGPWPWIILLIGLGFAAFMYFMKQAG